MKIEISKIQEGFTKTYCYAQSRVGVMDNLAVLTTQQIKLVGSDVYSIIYSRYSEDRGKTWSELVPQENFYIGENAAVCDFTPSYHKKTQTILGTGHSVRYDSPEATRPALNYKPSTYYSVYDTEAHTWMPVKQLLDSNGNVIDTYGAGCTQRYDLPCGDILLPTYCVSYIGKRKVYYVVVLRLGFDGKTLVIKEAGNELHVDEENRGIVEPSLAYFHGKYYLTLRADSKAYISIGNDGLNFSEPIPWTWDTGYEVPSYNTQQHWVVSSEGLYLVYTRKNGSNDHVPRNRAPLYMARVDTEKLCLLRQEEGILVPERGAMFGNFGIEHISDTESWVTETELMKPVGCEKYGSNNTIYLCRLNW